MRHPHLHHGAERILKGKTPEASADMNVTPLIDVLLVLLIIFMATLPLTQKGMDISLPIDVTAAPKQAEILNQIVVDYTADHAVAVNKQRIAMEGLEEFLRTTFETRKDKTLYLIGAGSVRYGEIMEVIDAAMGAGVTKIGVITDGMKIEAAAASQPKK